MVTFTISHLMLILCVPIEVTIHEAGHYYAAKYYNCYEKFDVSFRGKDYLAAVFTDQKETVTQHLIITVVGVITGIVFAYTTFLVTTHWRIIVILSVSGSAADLINLAYWLDWGKIYGYDKPMWRAPQCHWYEHGNAIELFKPEARDYTLIYIERIKKHPLIMQIRFHSTEFVCNVSFWGKENNKPIEFFKTSDLSLGLDCGRRDRSKLI